MRVTQLGLMYRTTNQLQSRLADVDRTQRELASGSRLLRPSDDPSAFDRGMRLRGERTAVSQFQRSAADAASRLAIADDALQGVTSQLQRARELAVRAGSNLGPDEASAVAGELREIAADVAQQMNTTYDSSPLFAGTSEDEAVTFDEIAGVWQYAGDDGERRRTIAEGETVTVNVTAGQALGFDEADDVLNALEDLANAVENGDQAGTTDGLEAVDRGRVRATNAAAELGVTANRVEQAASRLEQRDITLREQLAETEDVDLVEAVAEVQQREVGYQAALNVSARNLQPSLLDFLR